MTPPPLKCLSCLLNVLLSEGPSPATVQELESLVPGALGPPTCFVSLHTSYYPLTYYRLVIFILLLEFKVLDGKDSHSFFLCNILVFKLANVRLLKVFNKYL